MRKFLKASLIICIPILLMVSISYMYMSYYNTDSRLAIQEENENSFWDFEIKYKDYSEDRDGYMVNILIVNILKI